MSTVDLRSDTVTRPTPAMRDAMAAAAVGDDVYGEDPSINRLQEVAAERLGKEAALFVPSGTMANLAAILAHTRPGDLLLTGEGSHTLLWESGGAAAVGGVQIQTVGRGGLFDGDDVRAAVPPADPHCAPATLVSVENTHNWAGGVVFPRERVAGVAEAAREKGLALHLDGARLFNAEVATGIPVREWAEPFDSVAFCLSKGLGAPVGSLLCGSRALVERAHRLRKMLGGGMRQAGSLAAAGLYALEHQVERLAEDHANARVLAEGLEKLGLQLDPFPETNMVFFRAENELGLLGEAGRRGVQLGLIKPGVLRAVTHLDVSRDDVDRALAGIGEALAALRAG